MRAYARLSTPRPPLLIVGERDPAHVEAFAEAGALGLQDEIRFLERVADDALPALMRHARVFAAFPSFVEGLGRRRSRRWPAASRS